MGILMTVSILVFVIALLVALSLPSFMRDISNRHRITREALIARL